MRWYRRRGFSTRALPVEEVPGETLMHPVLIDFGGGYFIGTYGVMIAIGLAMAVVLASFLGKKRGYRPDVFFDLTFIAVLSGFVGARVLYILLDLPGFIQDPVPYLVSRTGFVFLGGFIGAAISLLLYIRKYKLDVWNVADIAGPGVAIGHAFGRIGCHLSGCCFGGQCTIPAIGIQVPKVELQDGTLWTNAYAEQLYEKMIPAGAEHSLEIWPVQLMESGSLLFLAAILSYFAMRRLHKGTTFGIYVIAYAVIRFILEFFRGDIERGMFFNGLLSTSQILSIAMFGAGIWVLATARKRPFVEFKAPPEDHDQGESDDDKEDTGTDGTRKRLRKKRAAKSQS